MSDLSKDDSINEKKGNRSTIRNIMLLFVIFSIVILVTGIVSYNLAAAQLKTQLTNKCQALAATVAAIIAEDSDGYAVFLEDMDMESEYYLRTKALMMNLKQVNVDHVTYVYTEAFVDENTKMYVIGGEDPQSPVYTGPGVTEAMTKAEKIAYSTQKTSLGEDFEDTDYGERLSAYAPIFHKETGEFLGLVGADIIRQQYNSIMIIFIVQTFVTIIAGLTIFALCMKWLSGNVNNAINKQRYEAEFARNIISTGRDYYERLMVLTENLQRLKHDHKFHLNAIQNLIREGNNEEARNLLKTLSEKYDEIKVTKYCGSRVLNALLYVYEERCEKENISFTVKIILPPKETIDDYELCVIIGNLLENAIAACLRTPKDKRRYIELSMRSREKQYGIKVENSYDGVLKHEGKELYSIKKDGGMGINSIKSVASRHNGEYVPVWDEDKFGAFVVLKLDDEE